MIVFVDVANRSMHHVAKLACVCAVLVFAACAPVPTQRGGAREQTPLAVQLRASPNFDQRRPNYVVIHHTTDNNAEEALAVLTDRSREVSAHYLIARDGTIVQLVDERARAWHAGESYWGGQRDMNSASIGIELDNNGREPFAEPQIQALLALLRDLKSRYNIPAPNFLGHADIAPGRKVDPSVLFPWKRLAEQGFGLWCEPTGAAAPPELATDVLLQAFGYSVWNLDAAVASFKLHFVPDDATPQMSAADRALLHCLVTEKSAGAVP